MINSLIYRISKFGKLAPKNELFKKLSNDENEENFRFYEDNSFIDSDDENEMVIDSNKLKLNKERLVTDEEIIREIKHRNLLKTSKTHTDIIDNTKMVMIRNFIFQKNHSDHNSDLIQLSSSIDSPVPEIKVRTEF